MIHEKIFSSYSMINLLLVCYYYRTNTINTLITTVQIEDAIAAYKSITILELMLWLNT